MLIVEIVLLVILLIAAGRGWRQGLVDSFGELAGAILAFIVARAVSPWFGTGMGRFIAFVIVALIVAKLVGMAFHIVAKMLKIITNLPLIHLVNNILGAILGFLSGVVLVGATTYIVLYYRLDPTLIGWFGGSTIARWCEAIFSNALRFLL
jgi:uncharacterized membrane protein required for colicin V production